MVASLAALSVAVPADPELPRTLRGEIDSVDNRAAEDGGGGPGELGGQGVAELLPAAERAPRRGARGVTRRPMPCSRRSCPSAAPADAAQRALPGPQTTGLGLLPGPGTGGGGGSGGGSGGGVGRGVGPGTEFFGAREHAGSFAYVIDCSGSMATRNSLDVAKRELLASLNQLPPDAQFAVDLLQPPRHDVFADPQASRGLMAATAGNKARVRAQLDADRPRRRHRPHARPPRRPWRSSPRSSSS